MTIWQKPAFDELAMNAEIGSYQAEDVDPEPHRWNTQPYRWNGKVGEESFVPSVPSERGSVAYRSYSD